MRLLLDTHTFLWWISNDPLLSATAKTVISDARNECFLSLASCWEMAIKSSIGKLRLVKPVESFIPEEVIANDFSLLAIDFKHIAKVETLPFYHRDPFDRLLVAQAIVDKMILVSADSRLSEYDIKCLW
ncbi:MAG: type II toxin-antitoxin system VapC family toxin [Trichlorobacter sp.]|jgi:PIN domain nuclease of toxin-antitoxin system|nr:type II toxin-antitoxin system VapC family toxin [Trichlorobacter sp.]